MYKPDNCKTLAEITEQQIRLGIQGAPGTGKTWAALTFPNPLVIDLDRGLGAHTGKLDVITVPMWDDVFCKTVNPNHTGPATRRDTVLKWFDKYGSKLEADQSLIYDGLSTTQTIFNQWYAVNPVVTSNGKVDDFGHYRRKIEFFEALFGIFKSLKCHVVLICHETELKEKGGYMGKIRPLLSGQVNDSMVKEFTDWFRQHSITKPKNIQEPDEALLTNFKMSKSEMIELCKSFPRNTIYAWQTDGDDTFDGKASSLVNFPKFIPANYESFKKHCRKLA